MISKRFVFMVLVMAVCVVLIGTGCGPGAEPNEPGYYSGKTFKRPGSNSQSTDKPVAEAKRGGG